MGRSPKSAPSSGKPQWSQAVTRHSNALDLAFGVFTWDNPRAIAESLKASAEASQRRKASPFRSAMSMLNFYINRAGNQLPDERRACLEQTKEELRELFGRPRQNRRTLRNAGE